MEPQPEFTEEDMRRACDEIFEKERPRPADKVCFHDYTALDGDLGSYVEAGTPLVARFAAEALRISLGMYVSEAAIAKKFVALLQRFEKDIRGTVLLEQREAQYNEHMRYLMGPPAWMGGHAVPASALAMIAELAESVPAEDVDAPKMCDGPHDAGGQRIVGHGCSVHPVTTAPTPRLAWDVFSGGVNPDRGRLAIIDEASFVAPEVWEKAEKAVAASALGDLNDAARRAYGSAGFPSVKEQPGPQNWAMPNDECPPDCPDCPNYTAPSGATMLEAAGAQTRICNAQLPRHPVTMKPDEVSCWLCQGTTFEVIS